MDHTGSRGIREKLEGTEQEEPFHSEPDCLAASLSDLEALIHSNSCCRSLIITPLNLIRELTVIHSAGSGCRFSWECHHLLRAGSQS